MDWVLETIPMAQPILPTSEYPVVYRSVISMGVVMLLNIKSLTVNENGNVFSKCHAPCSLKTSFEDF
jgi:hypothetical protein